MDAIPVPLRKFSHMHMDLVGSWPRTAEGHTNILTGVDRTTRWAEAIQLQPTTAQVVADSFVANWGARFGVCLLPSPQTRGCSSLAARGSVCAEPWAASTCRLLLTTLRPMAWWSSFTSS